MKRETMIQAVMMMAMFASPFGAWAQGNDQGNGSAVTSYGDVNEDGVVNIQDVISVNGHIIIGESDPVNVGGSGGDVGTGGDASETLYGDVNVDGCVDNLDVTLINKYLLGTAELSEQGKKNADVDANGTIDTTDSLNILKCCQKLIEQSEFPIK